MAASKATMRGPTIIKAEDDKTRQLNKNSLMAFSGEAGDTGAYSRPSRRRIGGQVKDAGKLTATGE